MFKGLFDWVLQGRAIILLIIFNLFAYIRESVPEGNNKQGGEIDCPLQTLSTLTQEFLSIIFLSANSKLLFPRGSIFKSLLPCKTYLFCIEIIPQSCHLNRISFRRTALISEWISTTLLSCDKNYTRQLKFIRRCACCKNFLSET